MTPVVKTECLREVTGIYQNATGIQLTGVSIAPSMDSGDQIEITMMNGMICHTR